jgi:hypothetical protein
MTIDKWTMAQAKRDFQIGYLTYFEISRFPMGAEWTVSLRGGTNRGPLVDARDKTVRLFKTLDACVAALEQIGFKVEGLAMH